LTGTWLTESLALDPVIKPAGNSPLWFAEVGVAGDHTTIWAQFPGLDPNEANVEIRRRQSVFYPSKPGINYITVRGFDLLAGGAEEGAGLGAPVAVEAIVGSPIVVLAVLGREQAGERMAAQGDELGQRMSGMAGGLGGGDQRTIQEGVQVLEEEGFFLSWTGSGGTN
jgi:hypothetical protein